MTRKFLEDMGLDKEVVDKIMTENGSDIQNARNSEKSKFDTERTSLQGQISELQGQVTQRDADLTDLQIKLTAAQADAGKLTEAQQALTGLQSKYDTERQEWEKKSAQQSYEFAIKTAAADLKFTSTAAKREFIRSAIDKKMSMEGEKVLGFSDYVEAYKKDDPGAFKVEDQPAPPAPPKPDIVMPGKPGGPVVGKTLSAMMKAKNENPDMVVNFDK